MKVVINSKDVNFLDYTVLSYEFLAEFAGYERNETLKVEYKHYSLNIGGRLLFKGSVKIQEGMIFSVTKSLNNRNVKLKMTYRDSVMRTSPDFEMDSLETKLSLGGLGLAGEAGEVVDIIKKIIHHKKSIDRDSLIEELGDVRWYLEYLAASLNVSMDEIEKRNVEKLLKRYPNGFNYKDANRTRGDCI